MIRTELQAMTRESLSVRLNICAQCGLYLAGEVGIRTARQSQFRQRCYWI